MSAPRSATPPSVFDHAGFDLDRDETPPTTVNLPASGPDEPSYDLKPPPPSISHGNVEALSERFFSVDHLDVILRDRITAARLQRFLAQCRPQHVPTLQRYMDTRKAITAVEYANALAEQIPAEPGRPYVAAVLDHRFEAKSAETVEQLVEEALPAYITHRLVTVVTDSLVKEITGNGAPVMRQLIPALAEVYCVTDPSLPDNPIVYASEEFYNVSQYGREYVIGRNCRFLQGPKSSNAAVRRMIDALTNGQEICETILNYRRDGTPFMNLLMIAPLYDNKGQVRYFLGCQIDVSPLVEGGKGLESFATLLAQDRRDGRFGGRDRSAPHALGELGQMLSEAESRMLRDRSRSFGEESASASLSTSVQRGSRRGRRILGMDDPRTEQGLWPHPSLGPSGRLPGVYQNVSLVRCCHCEPPHPHPTVLTLAVPPRAPVPIPENHVHVTSPAHTGLTADPTPRPDRWSAAHPRGHPRRSRPRHERHRQNRLAHEPCLQRSGLRPRSGQAALDPLHAAPRQRRARRRLDDRHGRERRSDRSTQPACRDPPERDGQSRRRRESEVHRQQAVCGVLAQRRPAGHTRERGRECEERAGFGGRARARARAREEGGRRSVPRLLSLACPNASTQTALCRASPERRPLLPRTYLLNHRPGDPPRTPRCP